jgi:hypothetical protein
LHGGGIHRQGNGLSAAAGQDLLATRGGLDGRIEKLPLQLGSCQALLRHHLAERLLHIGVQDIGQFKGVIAIGRLVDEDFYGSQQCAMAGEPDRLVRPETAIIEMGNSG